MEIQQDPYARLLNDLETADNKLKSADSPNKKGPGDKKGIFLTGPSKAGKTTFYYHLLGEPLKPSQYKGLEVFEPERMVGEAEVKHASSSTTRLPNIIEYSNTGVSIVDLPGFEDTDSLARISNSFFILKALKCFDSISFVFVVGVTAMIGNVDFEDSLNNFGGMFSDKQIDSVLNFISLCVSKASKEDTADSIIELLETEFPMDNLIPSAQKILRRIIQSKRINLFYKPSHSKLQAPGSKLFEIFNNPNSYWQVKQKEINYHVLMKQGPNTSYKQTAQEFLARNKEEHKNLFKIFNNAIREITDQRNQSQKRYNFINQIGAALKSPINVYKEYPKEAAKAPSDAYFSEYHVVKSYNDAMESMQATANVKPEVLENNLNAVLKAILKYGRLSEAQLPIWKKFTYMFNRKRREIQFMKFLLKYDLSATREDKDFFGTEWRDVFQVYCETLKVDITQTDQKYYETLLKLVQPLNLKRGGKGKGEDGEKIIDLMVNCYKRLGDLKKDLHESAMNYCKALIQKRLLMPKDKRQQHLCEEAELCSRIGNTLFEAEMYLRAIDFFKVCNNFTMICKCNLILNSSCHTLLEVGDYCASILQFEKAAEMYQRAFEESAEKKTKLLAWNKILKLRSEPQQFIAAFEKKIKEEELVGFYEKPEDALENIDLTFKVQRKKKQSAKVTINSIEEELNIIQKQLKAQLSVI